jgi:hypothetical protein
MAGANVTATALAQYLQVFHSAYLESVRSFLPKTLGGALLRESLSEHRVAGFVSTQFGAGYEYTGEGAPGTIVNVSSRRVEDIFLNDAPATVRKMQGMFLLGGPTGIMYLTIDGTFPFRLVAPAASIRLVEVGFRVQPWERVVRMAELYGDRSAEFWSVANAAARGVQAAREEANLALLDIDRSDRIGVSLAEYVRDFKSKMVLVLGDFEGAGAERLEAIKAALVRFGYQPILVSEVPDEPHQDLQQKALQIASVARFIVIDDSSKSGHLVEFPLIQANRWVTMVLRKSGSAGTFMTRGASVASNVIREATYTSESLSTELQTGTQWAEAKLQEVQRGLANNYPWREGIVEDQ